MKSLTPGTYQCRLWASTADDNKSPVTHSVTLAGVWAPGQRIAGGDTSGSYGQVYSGTLCSLGHGGTPMSCIIKAHVEPHEFRMHALARATATEWVLPPTPLVAVKPPDLLLLAAPRVAHPTMNPAAPASTTLAALMQSQSWCDELAVWVVRQVLAAVAALSGVLVHGDLHAHNVLVELASRRRGRRVVIIDFGRSTPADKGAPHPGAPDMYMLLSRLKALPGGRAREFSAWLAGLPLLDTSGNMPPDCAGAYTPRALTATLAQGWGRRGRRVL